MRLRPSKSLLARQPNTHQIDRDYIPFHACVLVLANRRRLSNRELDYYLESRPNLLSLIDASRGSQDMEEMSVVRRLTRFFEDPEDGVTQNMAIVRARMLVAQQRL